MSFVAWRAQRNSLPVDEVVQAIGIPLVSKCECCAKPSMETIDHVLNNGEMAEQVWKYFAIHFNLSFPYTPTWRGRMNLWWINATNSSQSGILRGITPIIITWALWKARCEAWMEGLTVTGQKIIWQIKAMLAQIGSQISKARKITGRDMQCLRALNCTIPVPQQQKIQMISWKKSLGNKFKLNVDGASKGNPGSAGGGGLIRDSIGTCWVAFAKHYGSCTNMEAESRALLDGLRMCRDLGIVDMLVETDSKVVVDWVTKGGCSLWWL